MKRLCGCDPCPPDALGNATLDEVLGAAPTSVMVAEKLDLSAYLRGFKNQFDRGVCVGMSFAQAAGVCARIQHDPNLEDLSGLSTYLQSIAISGRLHQLTDGSTLEAAVQAVSLGGYQLESEMPYDPHFVSAGFKLGVGQRGLRRCGLKAHRIMAGTIDEMKGQVKSTLCAGRTIVGGWKIDLPFEMWTPDKGPWDGLVQAPEGGHAMHVLDYPEGEPRIPNTWGDQKGDHGFWTFTWRALFSAMSLWAIDFVPLPG